MWGVVSMLFPSALRVRKGLTSVVGVAGLVGGVAIAALSHPAAPAQAGQTWPAQVTANYSISFNGFTIGSFAFKSRIGSDTYVLDGDAQISALLGIVSWRGLTRSNGSLHKGSPRPADYNFNFKSSANTGLVRIGFGKDRAKEVAMVPDMPVTSDEIRLKPEHVKGVLDPLSAVMAMTKGSATNPCERTLPVFDGKQRFDLKLSYRRQETINEMRPSGQPGVVIVCKVRYQPIAGYRPTADVKRMAESGDIEVALRPIPSANLFIPYEIRIPTAAGTVVLSSQTVDIVTDDRQQIALVH